MLEYKAPIRDITFDMQELLDCEKHYQDLGYQDATADMIDAMVTKVPKQVSKLS